MAPHINVHAWRVGRDATQFDVFGGGSPRSWHGLTRDQAVAALRLLGHSSRDASELVSSASKELVVRTKAEPILWIAHQLLAPPIWQQRIGVHTTNQSAREQVDFWIEDEFFFRPEGVPSGMSKAQLRDLYRQEFVDCPCHIHKLKRPDGLSIPQEDPPPKRHRIATRNIEVTAWLDSLGTRYDIDGGGPPRQWSGLAEAKAHEALMMLDCQPKEATEALDAAGTPRMLGLWPPSRAEVWVAIVAPGRRLEEHWVTLHATEAAATEYVDAWVKSVSPASAAERFRTHFCDVRSQRVRP
jgi:hypothetical protein